jgi:hypothetical protein
LRKKLQVEDNDEHNYTDDANNPPIEICTCQFEVNLNDIMKILKELKEENNIYTESESEDEVVEDVDGDFVSNFLNAVRNG